MPLKVLVAVNVLTEVDSQVYPSHLVHAFRMGRDTDVDFMLFTPRRMAIANARNAAVKAALQNDCDYLFFYDDDMDLHPKTFQKLVARGKDIIMGLCHIRGYPYRPMVFKWVEKEDEMFSIADQKVKGKLITIWDDCVSHKDDTGLINNVAAVGCACTLIRTDVFRTMEEPWFYTGTSNTEDIYFCIKAQKANPTVSIAVDCDTPVGHLLKDKDILYPENMEFLRKKVAEYEDFTREKFSADAKKQEV